MLNCWPEPKISLKHKFIVFQNISSGKKSKHLLAVVCEALLLFSGGFQSVGLDNVCVCVSPFYALNNQLFKNRINSLVDNENCH